MELVIGKPIKNTYWNAVGASIEGFYKAFWHLTDLYLSNIFHQFKDFSTNECINEKKHQAGKRHDQRGRKPR